jgi:hypothetical protein
MAAILAVAAVAVLSKVFDHDRTAGEHRRHPAGATSGATSGATTTSTDQPVSKTRGLARGQAVADDGAADATTAIDVSTGHDPDGAVEAFVSYATWAVASPAAANDPLHASAALGGKLNTADAAMVDAIDRTTEHDFVPSEGAYRVLGHSGSEAAPDQVMLEVVAPMTVGGQIMWRKIGGVISWESGRWLPTSMQPRDVPQPSDPSLPVVAMTDAERNRVLDGLGWELFSNAPQG